MACWKNKTISDCVLHLYISIYFFSGIHALLFFLFAKFLFNFVTAFYTIFAYVCVKESEKS